MPERRLAAIMFTDIVGYTALMGSDEDRAFEMLRRNRELHKRLIKKYGGQLIKEMGDGMLVSFHLASDAVRCAQAILFEAKKQQIPLKIGIHEGEMVFERSDVLGDGVNIASRLQEDAGEGCITISASVYRDIKNKTHIKTEFIGERAFKNVDEPVKVYRINCDSAEDQATNKDIPDTKDPFHPGSNGTSNRKTGIIYYLIAAIIIFSLGAVLLWKFLPGGETEELEKSIAVLPFNYLSEDLDKQYLADGVMDAITGHLSKIEGLRVTPRTSVEQYRETKKTASVIGKELNVSYLIEGNFLMIDDKVRLTIQLINTKSRDHIFYKEYDREYQDIFAVQSEVAQKIAKEIEVVVTPEEKQLIEKVPTSSLMANELYQRGREEYIKFLLNDRDRDVLTSAQEYYLKALEYDPAFAKACAGVAMTFYSKLAALGKFSPIYSEGYMEDNAFDTVLFWANKALHIDKQLPEAYYIRGSYYFETGNREKAEKDYHEAIQLNPNYGEAYYGLGTMYMFVDYVKALKYLKKAASLVRGPELSYILMGIIHTYMFSGVVEKEKSLAAKYVDLTQDSLLYYMANYWLNLQKGNQDDQHYWISRAYTYDSTNPGVLSYLAESYIAMGNFEEGLKYYKQSLDIDNALGNISVNRLHRIGYAFARAGYPEEADYYFDRAEEIFKSIIRLNRPWAQYGNTPYDLALIYAFRGEKSKAMEILRNLHQRSTTPYFAAWYMQWDPMLDGIRDDPEFQQIANDLGVKFQAEMKRVRQWVEKNDIL